MNKNQFSNLKKGDFLKCNDQNYHPFDHNNFSFDYYDQGTDRVWLFNLAGVPINLTKQEALDDLDLNQPPNQTEPNNNPELLSTIITNIRANNSRSKTGTTDRKFMANLYEETRILSGGEIDIIDFPQCEIDYFGVAGRLSILNARFEKSFDENINNWIGYTVVIKITGCTLLIDSENQQWLAPCIVDKMDLKTAKEIYNKNNHGLVELRQHTSQDDWTILMSKGVNQ